MRLEFTVPPTPATHYMDPLEPDVVTPEIHYERGAVLHGWNVRYPVFFSGGPFYGFGVSSGDWYYGEPNAEDWVFSFVDGWIRLD